MIKPSGKSLDFLELSDGQANMAISYMGFKDRTSYLKHINSKLTRSAGTIPPIKTVRDLSKVTVALGECLDDLMLGEEIAGDKCKIAELYRRIYPGEKVTFPEARIRLVMKLMDYMFSGEGIDSVQLN